jgi:hypothetical protein
MPRVEFEPTIPAFERDKTVHALDRAATVIGNIGLGVPYAGVQYKKTCSGIFYSRSLACRSSSEFFFSYSWYKSGNVYFNGGGLHMLFTCLLCSVPRLLQVSRIMPSSLVRSGNNSDVISPSVRDSLESMPFHCSTFTYTRKHNADKRVQTSPTGMFVRKRTIPTERPPLCSYLISSVLIMLITRNFIICSVHQIWLEWSSQGGWHVARMV